MAAHGLCLVGLTTRVKYSCHGDGVAGGRGNLIGVELTPLTKRTPACSPCVDGEKKQRKKKTQVSLAYVKIESLVEI